MSKIIRKTNNQSMEKKWTDSVKRATQKYSGVSIHDVGIHSDISGMTRLWKNISDGIYLGLLGKKKKVSTSWTGDFYPLEYKFIKLSEKHIMIVHDVSPNVYFFIDFTKFKDNYLSNSYVSNLKKTDYGLDFFTDSYAMKNFTDWYDRHEVQGIKDEEDELMTLIPNEINKSIILRLIISGDDGEYMSLLSWSLSNHKKIVILKEKRTWEKSTEDDVNYGPNLKMKRTFHPWNNDYSLEY